MALEAVTKLVAANGDELEITTVWRFNLRSFTALGEWEITGGTGRFENAKGSGMLKIVDGVSVHEGQVSH
jgi:hypothetical protein